MVVKAHKCVEGKLSKSQLAGKPNVADVLGIYLKSPCVSYLWDIMVEEKLQ